MSAGAARLAFLLLFVLNCLLWSNSRYAQSPALSPSHSLSKRHEYQVTRLSNLLFQNGTTYIDTKKQVRRLFSHRVYIIQA